jgi:hypothetical protein
MLVNVRLSQVNKAGTKVFGASAKVNIGNKSIESVSKEIRAFLVEVKDLQDKNAKMGVRLSGTLTLKKSIPLMLELAFEDDVLLLEYRNLVKIMEELTPAKLEKFLENNIGAMNRIQNELNFEF